MRRRTNNPWIDGDPADPFRALLSDEPLTEQEWAEKYVKPN